MKIEINRDIYTKTREKFLLILTYLEKEYSYSTSDLDNKISALILLQPGCVNFIGEPIKEPNAQKTNMSEMPDLEKVKGFLYDYGSRNYSSNQIVEIYNVIKHLHDLGREKDS